METNKFIPRDTSDKDSSIHDVYKASRNRKYAQILIIFLILALIMGTIILFTRGGKKDDKKESEKIQSSEETAPLIEEEKYDGLREVSWRKLEATPLEGYCFGSDKELVVINSSERLERGCFKIKKDAEKLIDFSKETVVYINVQPKCSSDSENKMKVIRDIFNEKITIKYNIDHSKSAPVCEETIPPIYEQIVIQNRPPKYSVEFTLEEWVDGKIFFTLTEKSL